MSISEREYSSFVKMFAALIIIGAITMVGVYCYDHNSVSTAIEQEYQCFYKGQEVDIDKIDVYQYRHRIDNENKRVYLSDKADEKFVANCPVIVPVH